MSFFQLEEYLEVFKKHFCKNENVVLDRFEKVNGEVMFLGMKPVLGGQEVTDYGDIQKSQDWPDILRQLKDKGVKKLRLDYVRENSETYGFFKDKNKMESQEVAPFIDLPTSWEEYLQGLKRKHRKELKRKMKRLDKVGTEYERIEKVKDEDFEEFIRLHRLSDKKKKMFMSEDMKKFFKDLVEIKYKDWKVILSFLKINGNRVAGVMIFESEDEMWVYNSGYDPEYKYYSAGLLLKAYLIKKAIEKGKKKFDFLRGGERYKYELGGKDMRLFKIEIKL